ncbi:MAG: uroporphyrinogen-III synthase [Sphingopyxis sp.]|nr:uroporphyrinogen-III synthase [Sphingopyxis sp.]
MTCVRPVIILRPEPENSATASLVQAAGLVPLPLPLFAIEALPWRLPPALSYDAVMLTSANAARMLGRAPDAVRQNVASLPLYCVGKRTAHAVQMHGMSVAQHGDSGVDTLLRRMADDGVARLLWLAGEERTQPAIPGGLAVDIVTTYRARMLPVSADAVPAAAIILVHSRRAARAIASILAHRATHDIVAISAAAADAAGDGWRGKHVARTPDTSDMVAIARQLCQ